MSSRALIALAEDIWQRQLTRNRHLELLAEGDRPAALRLKRYLDGWARELNRLQAAGGLLLRCEPLPHDRVAVHVSVPRLQLSRVTFFHREELAVMCRHHDGLAGLLQEAA
jgi:hypothetical protein